MASLNKVMIIGNVGQDPEIRYSESGAAVANLSIATSESWKDKSSGERVEKTEWHRVVFFGRSAEVIGEYVTKGSPLYIEGSLTTRKWQDKDGNDRYTTEIKGQKFEFLAAKTGASENEQAARTAAKPTPPSQPAQGQMSADFEDDIPF